MRSSCAHAFAIAVAVLGLGLGAASARAQTVVEIDGVDSFDTEARQRHWWRMLGETSALFTAMEVKYWIDKEVNQFDFEYDADWRNVRARFVTLEAWRLDDNFFNTNAWRHTVQGAADYMAARSNGFSSLESYFVSLAASGAWELIGEYKEEVSVNDLIMTPRSGFVVGESFWHLGVFFLRSEPTWYHQLVGNLFSGGTGVFRKWDGRHRWRSARTNDLGFDRTLGHQFTATVAGGTQRASTDDAAETIMRVTLDTDLTMIPGVDEPGYDRRILTDPSFSQMHLEWTWDRDAISDFEASARLAVTTWHRKSIAPDGDGHNLIYGLGSAYEYGYHLSRDRETRDARDRIAIGHIIGPTIDFRWRHAGLRLRATADGYGDMALVRNYAIDAHRALYPDDPVRTTILRDNYHHAWGLTGRGRLVMGYDRLEARLAYQIDRFVSVQGLDRHQDEMIDDYPLHDLRSEAAMWVSAAVRLPMDLAVRLDVGTERRTRSGSVKSTHRADDEMRYLGAVTLAF